MRRYCCRCLLHSLCQHMPPYVSIRQHTSAYVSIRQRQHTSAYVSASIRQHTCIPAALPAALSVRNVITSSSNENPDTDSPHTLPPSERDPPPPPRSPPTHRQPLSHHPRHSEPLPAHNHLPCQNLHLRPHCKALLRWWGVCGGRWRAVSIRQHTSAYVSIRQHTSEYVSMRQNTSEYVSIRQHTSAYLWWPDV
jgi:hypothetical protein